MMYIDTHQHFWNLSEVEYSWLTPAYDSIYKTFQPHDLAPLLTQAGISKTVLVQSANSYEDTASMLTHADYNDWIGAVIGWVDLLNPDATQKRLEQYQQHPKFRGIRHLIHDEPDPDWVIQETVVESLKILVSYKMTFDIVAVFPNHIRHIPTLSERVPDLRMVIDHLAKPPIKTGEMSPWSDQMRIAAQNSNVYAKVSGLNTAAPENWSATHLQPYIDFALDTFGSNRLMFGSDWPVCLLAGDYQKVWNEIRKAIANYPQTDQDAILGGTAISFYRL